MGHLIDLTGEHFGRLTVLGPAGSYVPPGNPFHRETLWRCLCDPERGGCGQESLVLGHNLRNGQTRSCGCLRTEKAVERLKKYRKGKKT